MTHARLHVLDKRDGERHTPERHEAAKVRFTLEDRAAVILGFYSTAHRGIFTPADADVHMHLKTADDRISGHVERVRLAAGARLGFPEEEVGAMRISARNVIKGRIVEVVKGATTAHVKLDVGGGTVITASITNEAVEELRLAKGDAAYAVIKASDVMVGKD